MCRHHHEVIHSTTPVPRKKTECDYLLILWPTQKTMMPATHFKQLLIQRIVPHIYVNSR